MMGASQRQKMTQDGDHTDGHYLQHNVCWAAHKNLWSACFICCHCDKCLRCGIFRWCISCRHTSGHMTLGEESWSHLDKSYEWMRFWAERILHVILFLEVSRQMRLLPKTLSRLFLNFTWKTKGCVKSTTCGKFSRGQDSVQLTGGCRLEFSVMFSVYCTVQYRMCTVQYRQLTSS